MKLNFKLTLYSQYWNREPGLKVFVNDTLIEEKYITESADDPCILEFSVNNDSTDQFLCLEKFGKTIEDTLVEDGQIVKDQSIHIVDLEINQIPVDKLIYRSYFVPEYPEPWASEQKQNGNILPERIKPCTDLFHNGKWIFEFSTPFHIWFLENQWG